MFFDNLEEIPNIVKNVGCAIFVIPNGSEIKLKNATVVRPGEIKTGIIIDQVKEVISHATNKEQSAKYTIIYEAEQMNEAAANAFLKNLEEPKDNYHYILQTENLSALLPTIISRSAIFILKQKNQLESEIKTNDEIKTLAKKLIVAKDIDYPKIMAEITKKKDEVRPYALEILKTAIEMSYKSYFKTNNQTFLKKIPKFIKAYENIAANGHIKLHLVADML